MPSQVAAASVFIALLVLHRQPWTATLQHYSEYHPQDFRVCAEGLAAVHASISNSEQLQAMHDKYSHSRFLCVAQLPPVKLAPAHFGV